MKLLRQILAGVRTPAVRFDAQLAPDEPVAVIGDIHGCAELLGRMLDRLEAERVTRRVFVGDYVDRGDESAGVLDTLRRLEEARSDIVCLMGNHERMMLDFLDDPAERGGRWLRNGGLQTLASYGIGAPGAAPGPEELAEAAVRLRRCLAPGLEDWIRARPFSWKSGNLWVVHAGADPARPMEEQSPRVMLWGHPDFATTDRDDSQWVAHGHTIIGQAAAGRGRIAVDTGAFATGRLSAAILFPGQEARFVTA